MRKIVKRRSVFIIVLISLMISIIPFHANGFHNDEVCIETSSIHLYQDNISINSQIYGDYFITNTGQIPLDDDHFYSSSGDIHFLSDGVLMRFREIETQYDYATGNSLETDDPYHQRSYHEKGVVLKYSFIKANKVIPIGNERCSWDTNYFKGQNPEKWYTDIPNYREIIYEDIWDGIDIAYRLKDGKVKYDIILSPGADPEDISIQVDG